MKKIKRDIFLIKYRKMPLLEYDKKTDSDIYYYPECNYIYWIKIEKDSPKKLISEFMKLIEFLKFKKLIFFGSINKPWISKFTSKRDDYKRLTKALKYFDKQKIDTKFNGGVEVELNNLQEFLLNFYTITQCDGGFFDYYFSDINENILFHLYYTGEFKILPLSKKMNRNFLSAVKKTNFNDALRNEDETDRI
ncbi:hypothetical protein [Riemerella anatipestifer]|uniref:hypothetical protein n=1 Tax=Riemerella anatipestifer TaxID=34085 RepID=UPI00129D9983|nr:hypothetical protein [Riemerella anatipestifer]MBT0550844.1 hypothetical protein [Riemerella anatipestifer]MBT0553442.1 hypothetical protein [Riemerella anatipestifer]MCE3024248.1 hypothetical protein [Riemerella anatipestifer]MCU7541874.1 hypothetical protein [Riemerella anatipestifer]MCU7558978.1 hypothetical protein [Riemerella anatipestifer]